ncbi:MAG: hypothetical protein H6706_26665 [Myxococcales bacterium]|nr:hypothetical protein [Myxococcales bacterium]
MRLALPLLLLASVAAAAPEVAVKARTAVADLRASNDGGRVLVTGTLRDNLGQPVPLARLVVVEGEQRVDAQTGPDGRFEATLEVEGTGARGIRVEFRGDALLSGADSATTVRVGRRAVILSLAMATTIEAGEPATASVSAVDAEGAPVEDLQLQVRLDADTLTPVRLGPAGQAAIPLPAVQPGTHRLRVYWPGDAHRVPADAEVTFSAGRSMALTLEAADAAPAPGQPVVLTGRVARGPDQPVSVRLTMDGRPLDDARTDSSGGFRFTLDAADLPAGLVRFRVAGRTDAEGWRDALSPVVTVQIPPPPPPSPWWLWAPAILAALSLAAVLGRAWRKRPRPVVSAPRPAPALPPPFVFDAPADAPAGTLALHLRDALTGAPLRGTVVWLPAATPPPAPADTTPPAGVRAETDADGQATLTGSGDRVWAWAEGYAPVCHPLPAAGGRARLALLPIRARVQTLYDEVLVQAGRPPLRFGRQTPREAAVPLAQRGAPADALAALTALVERACFDEAPVPHAVLVEAHALADAVRGGMARA